MYAIFDKNKKFLGYSNDSFEDPKGELLKKQIPDEQSGNDWSWVGDMDTGKMVVSKNIY